MLLPCAAFPEGFVINPRDIEPGSDSSQIEFLTDVGGVVFFAASTLDQSGSFFNTRLWVSNGTEEGTLDLDGFNIGEMSAVDPSDLVNAGGVLFFSAEGRDFSKQQTQFFGRELWRSDGTLRGTVMVADAARQGANSSPSSFPKDIVDVDGTIFFSATNEVGQDRELWMSDGIPGGVTVRAADINPGEDPGLGQRSLAIAMNGWVFFWANDGSRGYELWKSNGATTTIVKDINTTSPGASSIPFDPNPLFLGSRVNLSFKPVVMNGVLYFLADDGINGVELWRTDGTEGGTTILTNLAPLPARPDDGPAWLTPWNGTLYFTAEDAASGRELYKTDGFVTGTRRVIDLRAGQQSSRDLALHDKLAVVDGQLYFAANDGTSGTALWKTDGTEPGTVLVADLNPGNDGLAPVNYLTEVGGLLYFAADNGNDGVELWQSDGSGVVTFQTDINETGGSSIPLIVGPRAYDIVRSGNRLFLPATDGEVVVGDELWVTASIIPPMFPLTRTRMHEGQPPLPGFGTDLELEAAVVPELVDSEGLVTYFFTITNHGPALAVDIRLRAAGFLGVPLFVAPPGCFYDFGLSLNCFPPNLPSEHTYSGSFIAQAPPAPIDPFPFFAEITVSHSGVDPDFTDNVKTVTATAVPPVPPPPPPTDADLSITKTSGRDPVTPGTTIDYQISVLNGGPGAATGIVVRDTLPAGVSFESASPDAGGACNEKAGIVSCSFTSLASGSALFVDLVGLAPVATGVVTNTASVTALEADPDPSNNTISIDTLIEDRRPAPEPAAGLLALTALLTLLGLQEPGFRQTGVR